MKELYAILDSWQEASLRHEAGVLATVVRVQGSAYRRPGARMLMLADGRRVGSVSGGCLEGDLSKKAWWLTEQGRPTVRVYDTSSEEDAIFEFGLGCNGVVHVLLERLESHSGKQVMQFLDDCRHSAREAALATVIQTDPDAPYQVGDRLFIEAGRGVGGELCGSLVERDLISRAAGLSRVQPTCLVQRGPVELLLEWIGPPLPLVIFGAGHDAVPLVNLAREMGWSVTVADGRPGYARPERFPLAERVVVLPHQAPLSVLEVPSDAAVVVMTHNYAQDGRLIRALLPRSPRYLGLLGPRSRAERLLSDLGLPSDSLELHAPVGLDIGADSPEAIALAIVAEIQSTLAGRAGGMLRWRATPIHECDEQERPQCPAH